MNEITEEEMVVHFAFKPANETSHHLFALALTLHIKDTFQIKDTLIMVGVRVVC
jgi:hypothetical protein